MAANNGGSILDRLFGRMFKSKDEKISNLEREIDETIKEKLPSLNKSGEDRALTDTLARYVTKGAETQYSFTGKNGRVSKSTIDMLSKDVDNTFTDLVERKDLYNTYRYLIKNIPQLNAAIDVIVENIISPDEIFKEVIRITPSSYNFMSDENNNENSAIRIEAADLNNILNILNIEEKLFPWLSNCLLTGNTFIEIIDANKATSLYLAESESIEKSTNKDFIHKIKESERKKLLSEMQKAGINSNNIVYLQENEEGKKPNTIELSENVFVSNILENEVFTFTEDHKAIKNSHKVNQKFSIYSFSDNDYRDAVFNKKFDDAKGENPKNKKGRPSNKEKNEQLEKNGKEEVRVRISDIILKHHESETVIRIVNSGFLLGYLVVKDKSMETGVQNKIFGNIGNSIDLTSGKNKQTSEKISGMIIDKILSNYKNEFANSGISKSDIDTPDMRKLIASIIMEKKTANIRFIAPSDMIEFINYSQYGEKTYGVSVLDSCLFLAKYYIALLVSYTIFNITRAPEKRLFRVSVQTDTDIKNAIEQVVSQVKQKEIAFRDFHKQDAMPKELTAYDDIFIPMVNNESPISIESIPGQSNNIDTSYLDDIRRMIINATKVPPSLLGDTENSYHTTASQENQKFARTIIRYQQQFQNQLTTAISKIYYKLNGNNEIKFNKLVFNPPAFTKVEQSATMIGQAQAICDFISNAYGVDATTSQPKLPMKLIAKEIAPFIPWDKFDNIYEKHNLDTVQSNELNKLQNKDKTIDQEVDDQIADQQQ